MGISFNLAMCLYLLVCLLLLFGIVAVCRYAAGKKDRIGIRGVVCSACGSTEVDIIDATNAGVSLECQDCGVMWQERHKRN